MGFKSTVTEFLHHSGMRTAYLPRVAGNHGDRLILLGLLRLLRQNSVTLVHSPRAADWIIIQGSGGMNDYWGSALLPFKYFLRAYPRKPIAVMPSSYFFQETDFGALLCRRESPCVLFAREHMSLRYLLGIKTMPPVEVCLDHDTALALKGTKLFSVPPGRSPAYILIIERRDAEHHASSLEPLKTAWVWRRSLLLEAAKAAIRPARRTFFRLQWRARNAFSSESLTSSFQDECEALIARDLPHFAHLPRVVADVSNPLRYTFRQFCSLISRASAIITTRLHPGIMGAALGIPTYLRGGGYGKIAAVFEYSLRAYPSVHLFAEQGILEDVEVPRATHDGGHCPLSVPKYS